METRYDYLIVGAGLFGSVFAYAANKNHKKCLVIDKRNHTGGNIYCENIAGINVHKYGAHIFHTSNEQVWDFVTGLVEFNRYTNCPVAQAPDGKMYNLPFNMNTFYALWGTKTPEEAMRKLEEQRQEALEKLGNREPSNLEEQALILIGRDIFEKLIKGYTEKQWGRKCSQLPPEIIRRLPVRLTFDNNYFNDRFQGIPIGGYNSLIEKLLEGCEVVTGCDYLENRNHFDVIANRILYTGPIDAFFEYKAGHLEYRTVNFETEILNQPNYQGNAVVNYTSAEIPYTRIIEHKHFESFGDAVYENPKTVISREYSTEWKPGIEPYYPINDKRNTNILEAYNKMKCRLPLSAGGLRKYLFGGRLAEYKYYDMAPIIEKSLSLWENHE